VYSGRNWTNDGSNESQRRGEDDRIVIEALRRGFDTNGALFKECGEGACAIESDRLGGFWILGCRIRHLSIHK
jgi:hypothetical protein